MAEEEKDVVRRRDWRGLIRYGVISFGLEKLAAFLGLSNVHVCARMCAESLEDFLKTRNSRALYSESASAEASDPPDNSWT